MRLEPLTRSQERAPLSSEINTPYSTLARKRKYPVLQDAGFVEQKIELRLRRSQYAPPREKIHLLLPKKFFRFSGFNRK